MEETKGCKTLPCCTGAEGPLAHAHLGTAMLSMALCYLIPWQTSHLQALSDKKCKVGRTRRNSSQEFIFRRRSGIPFKMQV